MLTSVCRRCHMGESRASSIVAFGDHLCSNSIPFIIRASLVTQMVKNLPAVQETQVWSLGGDPLEKGWLPRWQWWKRPAGQCRRRKRCGFCPWIVKVPRTRAWQPAPVFLPGEFQGQGILVGYSPWGHKELDTTEQLTLSLWEVAVACHGRGTKEQICLVPRQFDRSSRWYISSGWAYQFDLSLSSMLCLKY